MVLTLLFTQSCCQMLATVNISLFLFRHFLSRGTFRALIMSSSMLSMDWTAQKPESCNPQYIFPENMKIMKWSKYKFIDLIIECLDFIYCMIIQLLKVFNNIEYPYFTPQFLTSLKQKQQMLNCYCLLASLFVPFRTWMLAFWTRSPPCNVSFYTTPTWWLYYNNFWSYALKRKFSSQEY